VILNYSDNKIQQDGNNAHCPSPDLKRASGFVLVSDLLAHGINVCIGTDGADSNQAAALLIH
jgi:5-methylthioadenosine/S-adenosylhomocysteine deaminase